MDERPRDIDPYFGALKGVLLIGGWALFGVGVYYSYVNSWAAASLYVALGLGCLGWYIRLAKIDRDD